jgi:hypothetical protein
MKLVGLKKPRLRSLPVTQVPRQSIAPGRVFIKELHAGTNLYAPFELNLPALNIDPF